MKGKLIGLILVVTLLCGLAGCAAGEDFSLAPSSPTPQSSYRFESFNDTDGGVTSKAIVENRIISAATTPSSSFSLDINTASYSSVRNMINKGYTVPANSVRIEEMVNYFRYDLAEAGEQDIGLSLTLSRTRWNENSYLLAASMATKQVELSGVKNNLVFLIDVSGSMYGSDRLPLVQTAFSLLTDCLNDDDTVSIVTYASGVNVALDSAKGAEKLKIKAAIDDLQAGGSTAGANGIGRAYALAEANFITGGNNRVIMATDGDFNVGPSSVTALEELISEKRDSGVYLSVLGFGYGNLRDDKLETLATNGNGNYAYIDTVTEAKKALVQDIGGTLVTVAKDAKAQVTFNADVVDTYRLLGYENKQLSKDEWEDAATDAGEIGAGHTVTAVYEITLKEGVTDVNAEIAKYALRYKLPSDDSSKELSTAITRAAEVNVGEDMRFIGCVIEFALLLRNSEYKGAASYEKVYEELCKLSCTESDEYKKEFKALVEKKINSNAAAE